MFSMTIIVGRLGNPPESRTTASGKLVATFSVATDHVKGGERHTEWHRCVAFDKTAEFVAKTLRKGDVVVVQGSTRSSTYTDKDGIERRSYELMTDRLQLVPTGKKDGSEPASASDPKSEDEYGF